MARFPRPDLAGIPQHVVQRGNNRLPCFLGDGDRQRYLQCLRAGLTRFGCQLHAYVLVGNHVHLLLTPGESGPVSRLMHTFARNYVGLFNSRHGRPGTLWEGRYKACLLPATLTRQGWLECEDESAFLSDRAGCDDGLDALRLSSITYRIATGKHSGRKVATLQTIPADNGPLEGDAGKVGGFSLHAGVAAEAHEARSSSACAGTLHARRSARSACRSRHGAGCVTSSRRRGRTARRTWSLSRWSSSPNWRRWCRHRVHTSPASTASLRQTRSCARS